MARLPRTISFKRLREKSGRGAASTCPRPSGLRYSSRRISPGAIAGPSQSARLVIVFDPDFIGITALPSKRHAILIVDPDAVPTCAIAFQPLEAVIGGNRQVFQP